MHGEHGDADVNNVDVKTCNVKSNCSAAACVYGAELADLPYNLVLLKGSREPFP